MFIKKLSYLVNSQALFTKFAQVPWSIWLDSCHPYTTAGRFDIISAYPETTLTAFPAHVIIEDAKKITQSPESLFNILKDYLPPIKEHASVPFCGGAIGYFSFDLSRTLEKLPSLAKDDIDIPLAAVGIYPGAIVIDHQEKTACYISYLPENKALQHFEQLDKLMCINNAPLTPFKLRAPFTSNMHFDDYQKQLTKILTYLYEGDCYQVNFAQRFKAPYEGDPFHAYCLLRQKNPAPFAGFFNTPFGQILSCSPERFLKVEQSRIETKPIKGTRPRSHLPEKDEAYANELRHSEKDLAENLMIVDLMRNDLGKVCVPGSIKVPSFCELESFATVHHLVSTVIGKLDPRYHCSDLLAACFPGGSITGTPKIRAMEIIDELEPHRRAIYCGAVGYIDPQQNMDINIAIRTVLCHENDVYVYGGGAIVADSVIEEEYAESLAKVNIIMTTLSDYSGMISEGAAVLEVK